MTADVRMTLVVATEWDEFHEQTLPIFRNAWRGTVIVVDGRNIFHARNEAEAAGFTYFVWDVMHFWLMKILIT